MMIGDQAISAMVIATPLMIAMVRRECVSGKAKRKVKTRGSVLEAFFVYTYFDGYWFAQIT